MFDWGLWGLAVGIVYGCRDTRRGDTLVAGVNLLDKRSTMFGGYGIRLLWNLESATLRNNIPLTRKPVTTFGAHDCAGRVAWRQAVVDGGIGLGLRQNL